MLEQRTNPCDEHSPPLPDRQPVLKIAVSIMENDDVLETLYTDASFFDVRNVLREHMEVFDTEAELDEAREGKACG